MATYDPRAVRIALIAAGSMIGAALLAALLVAAKPTASLNATSSAFATPAAPAPRPAPAPSVDVAAVKVAIAAEWTKYDARKEKNRDAIGSATQAANQQAARLSEPELTLTRAEIDAAMRERMAPLVQPETRADGPKREVLLASPNAAKCRVWASMWTGDDETLRSLLSLGFESIKCPGKVWDLRDVARTCILYSTDEEGEAAPVFVWKTQEYFERGQVVGRQTGDKAAMRMLALVSAGASTMMPGGHFVIQDTGPGWLRINGRDVQSGIGGYVEPSMCHRKAP